MFHKLFKILAIAIVKLLVPRWAYLKLLEDGTSMQKIAQEALDICHFDEHNNKHSGVQAYYQSLLLYTNQFNHPNFNRHLILDFLVQLQSNVINIELDVKSREA